MGNATLGPHRFRLDPQSVQWNYKIRAVDIGNVGGKVVQVLGSSISDMTVVGSFGTGGWKEQEKFLAVMKGIGDTQVAAQRISQNSRYQPFRFKYPPKGWDFAVYLTAYTQPGAPRSIRLDPKIHAPQWQLTLAIVDGAQGLKKIAQDAFIARMSAGLGWKQTEYNGLMTSADVAGVLDGRSVQDYLAYRAGFTGALNQAERNDGGQTGETAK